MKSKIKSFFAISLILLITVLAKHALGEPIDKTSSSDAVPITFEILYCLDQGTQYTIDSISDCNFKSRENLPIARLAHSEFWIKATASTPQNSLHKLIVSIRPHFLYDVSLYEKIGDEWHIQQAGSKYSSKQYQSTLGGYSFLTHDIQSNQVEIFLQIKTSGLIYSAINIEPYTLKAINKNNQQLGIGIQIGALVFVFLFLVTAHLLNPKLKLGRFTVLMTIVLLSYLSGSGTLSEYLFTNTPQIDDSIFLGLFFLRITGWIWVAQGILSAFNPPRWYNMTCIAFYCVMSISLVLNQIGFNATGGGLMVLGFFVSHGVQIAAVVRVSNMPKLYKKTFLVALILSDAILALTLLMTQYPIISDASAIYFSRIGDFVHPLILLFVILFGGKIVLDELNNTKDKLQEVATQAELERALQNERKLLVDMLTHEIRTPLGAIRLAFNSIKRHFKNEHNIEIRRFNNINQSLSNIDNVIEHCSLMNQVDQQALEVKLAPLNLNIFIKNFASETDDLSLSRLTFNLQSDVCLKTDDYILKIIFTNLVQNALKYSPPHSTVWIALEINQHTGGKALIKVSNQIIHDQAPDLNKIFDRYYRDPYVKNISGTGLGLHLSRELSIKLGGKLHASIQDEIITFTLSLPMGVLS